jgi:eukaryotic-like serine/threonine-protein kinase
MNQPFYPNLILGKRYKLIRQLGTGGFGQTFLAQDLHLPNHPLCVVKHLSARTRDAKRLQTARRLFDTEAKVLYQLGSHPQIPALLAHFEENQEFYLVQEFIDGEPLTEQFAPGEVWSEGRVLAFLRSTLKVLAFVHQQNVIHRDIKPSNLMIRRSDNAIVLIDFGAVKEVGIQSDETSLEGTDLTVSIGTHGYIPSEQLAGKPRFSSDIYAVGMTSIQALTGIHPKQLGENPQTGEFEWHIHALTVSPALVELIDRMVRYDFRERYPTAIEALAAITEIPEQVTEAEFKPSTEVNDLFLPRQAVSTLNQPDETQVLLSLTEEPTVVNSSEETSLLIEETKAPLFKAASPTVQPFKRLQPGSNEATFLQNPSTKVVLLLAGVAVSGGLLLSLQPGLVPKTTRQSIVPTPTQSVTKPSPKPSVTPLSPEQKANTWLAEADRFQKQQQYQKALAKYNQVIQLKPKLAQAHWGRCASLVGLKQPAQAIVACDDALAIKPKYPEALWSKGRALRQQQRVLEALSFFERATTLKANFPEAWVDRGSTLQELGRSVEAIAALDKAIAYNRNSAEAWSIRGSALWNLGRYDQAITSLDKALQIQPNAASARALRQQAREELGY